VKAEPLEGKFGGVDELEVGSPGAARRRREEEEEELEEDPLSYDQYYPAMLPHRWIRAYRWGLCTAPCTASLAALYCAALHAYPSAAAR
jgi:hypothetical protein